MKAGKREEREKKLNLRSELDSNVERRSNDYECHVCRFGDLCLGPVTSSAYAGPDNPKLKRKALNGLAVARLVPALPASWCFIRKDDNAVTDPVSKTLAKSCVSKSNISTLEMGQEHPSLPASWKRNIGPYDSTSIRKFPFRKFKEN